MKKKKHTPSNCFADTFPLSSLIIDDIKVTYEQSSLLLSKHFSKKEKETFSRLLQAAQVEPKKVYKEIIAWDKKAPELDNLLTYLYLQHKQVRKAEILTRQSYENYPDYIFARINYADQCLRKNRLDKIPEIFPCLSLKELFPQRRSFHVSEFRGFMTLMSHYHIKLKNIPLAIEYYQKAVEADPAHPSIIFLEKKLFPKGVLKKFFHKILKLARI
jgi:tetratricopeptide (TPR) repeat protein